MEVPPTGRALARPNAPTASSPGGRVAVGPGPRGDRTPGARIARPGPMQDGPAARAYVADTHTAPDPFLGAVVSPGLSARSLSITLRGLSQKVIEIAST